MNDDIRPDSPLGQVLSGYAVPELSPDFADRVLAASAARAQPLPPLRPARPRWRSARRLAVGVVAFGALAGAAAAMGLLKDLPVEIPSAAEVWDVLVGETAAPPKPALVPAPTPSPVTAGTLEEILSTPISTIEELEAAYRKIDALREQRSAERRKMIDTRFEEALKQRRAQGLPAPSAQQEQELRERLDLRRQRREAVIAQGRDQRRSAQRARVEQGETLTGADLIGDGRNTAPPAVRERFERLRELSPEERQQLLRRRRQRFQDGAMPAPQPVPEEPSAPITADESAVPGGEEPVSPPSATIR